MYDTLEEYLVDHDMTLHQYKRQQAIKKTRIANMRTFIDRKRKENKMANTFTIKRRNNAPNFVFGSFGCKYDDLKAFVNDRGYINFDILMGKDSDSYYVKVSDYGINQSVTKSDTDTVMEFDEEMLF